MITTPWYGWLCPVMPWLECQNHRLLPMSLEEATLQHHVCMVGHQLEWNYQYHVGITINLTHSEYK